MSGLRRGILILGWIAVVGLVVWMVKFAPRLISRPSIPSPVPSVEEMHQAWRKSVLDILEVYDRTGQAGRARDALLQLRVVRQDRDLHLELTLAFYALSEGQPEGAQKLAQARKKL